MSHSKASKTRVLQRQKADFYKTGLAGNVMKWPKVC
jgi:hypothetical protein